MALALTRAEAYHRIAAALPPSDPRVPVFKRLAGSHAAEGLRSITEPATFTAPWLGTLAVNYSLLPESGR
jgi:hypothetical protein